MQANSINRAAINWVDFKKNLLAQASGAKTIQQAYPAVVFAIVALGDKHSFFVPASPVKGPEAPAKQPQVYLDEPMPKDIGYIRIPWVVGSQEKLDEYIANVQAQIKERDKLELKGWLVDLRCNIGVICGRCS
jgi:carboxyl-terminal processing protease